MNKYLTYIISEENNGIKLRDFIKENLQLSTRLMRGAAGDKRIKINGNDVKLNYILRSKDILEIDIIKEETQNIEPEDINLDIVYEDDDIIVVNKPPFMVVHPTKSHPNGTLANGILYHFQSNGENCIVRLVSRLDRDTSGLIVIAKNQYSHMFLAKEMEKNTFKKAYMAVVWGNIENSEGTLDLPIYRTTLDSIKRIVDEKGQRSITNYKIIEHIEDADLVRLELQTGRTHQIRVHLSHIKHPIIGDVLYGKDDDVELINRQALHASEIRFVHPRTKEIIALDCEMPKDMKELIKKLRNG